MDNNSKKKLLTGIFIISGVVLLLIMLFVLGLSDLFSQKIIMHTAFTESVQGLTRGSAVKYRGVQIGTVTNISILVNAHIIQVDMEIEPEYFAVDRSSHRFPENEFHAFINTEIKDKGLRARLEMLGITGMKFIDLDYFAKPGTPLSKVPRFSGTPGGIYIPSVISQMKDLSVTLTSAVDRLSRIRYEHISEQLENALTGLGQLLNSQEIRSTIARINDTAENLETSSRAISSVLSESRILNVVNSLQQNLAALNKLQQNLLTISNEAKIPETTAAFRHTLEDVSESRRDIEDVVRKLNQTLESIRVLTDYLSTDPAALLRGKKQKPVLE
ncbi:MAG: MCE family protein [Lentisphaeria bacterium]|nr:MCE family protein [Lentisphaeria bacterium]